MSTGRFEQPWEALERIAMERQRATPVDMSMLTAITPREAGLYMRRIQAAQLQQPDEITMRIRATPFVQTLLVTEYVRVGHGSDSQEAAVAAIRVWESLYSAYQQEQAAAVAARSDAARRAMAEQSDASAENTTAEADEFGYRDAIPDTVPSASIRPSRRRPPATIPPRLTFADLIGDSDPAFTDQPIFDEIQRQWREMTGELAPRAEQMTRLIAAARADYMAMQAGEISEPQFRAVVQDLIAGNRDRDSPRPAEPFPAPIPTQPDGDEIPLPRAGAFTELPDHPEIRFFTSADALLDRYNDLRTTSALAWIEFEARGPRRRFTLLCLRRPARPGGMGFMRIRGEYKRTEDGLYETTPAEASYIFNQINSAVDVQAPAGDSRAIDLE